jgi:hypothetical protein
MTHFQLFISYCHKDNEYRQELEKWLVNLSDSGLIEKWHDGDLCGGDHLMEKIFKKMEEAEIILLLLSQDYFASNACKKEMAFALSISNKKRVVPIILRDCTWLDTGCKDLLALPTDGHPIALWDIKDKAWNSIYEGIKKVINDMMHTFEIKDNFLNELQQIEFVNQKKEKPKLEDIFVFPNLKRHLMAFERENINIDFFLEKREKSILIRGRESSGKTALARSLFMELNKEYSPILVDGNTIYKTLNFKEHFKNEFSKQISGDFDTWIKMDNKVAIIDNYHHKISSKLIDFLDDNFVMTIITIDDEEFMLYFRDDPNLAKFCNTSINQLSLVQQEQLIRKWLYLNPMVSIDDVSDLDVDKLEARVNSIITTNSIVPRYPFFVLTILQAFEAFMPSNLQITAFGHCYQTLVTAQLIKKNINFDDIDTCFNYLKMLSFDIFEKTREDKLYSKSVYIEFQKQYKSKFIIIDSLIKKIENDDYPVINMQTESLRFEYEYIYYFFLGMYFASNEHNKTINHLCENIHIKENAYILIFTIHHTHDTNLLDTIRLHCLCSFDNLPTAELSTKETQFMNNLVAELPQSIILEKDIKKNRTDERNHKDSSIEKQNEERSNEKNDPSVIEIQKGIKIIEVLGQILKNRAGSFEKKDVLEMLGETVDLGLRILYLFLKGCQDEDFKDWLTKSLQLAEKDLEETKRRKFDDEKRKIFVEKMIQFFGYMVTIGMLNRISGAIGSQKLISIMTELSESKNTPAYHLINFRISLSHQGVDLESFKSMMYQFDNTKNFWARRTLSYYVQNHLNTHHLRFQDRQKIYNILDIKKYIPNKG